jgi:hypothetical protein
VQPWLKAIHYDEDEDWTVAPGEEVWISDAGRRKNGKRVYRSDGQPWGEPSWEIT